MIMSNGGKCQNLNPHTCGPSDSFNACLICNKLLHCVGQTLTKF